MGENILMIFIFSAVCLIFLSFALTIHKPKIRLILGGIFTGSIFLIPLMIPLLLLNNGDYMFTGSLIFFIFLFGFGIAMLLITIKIPLKTAQSKE